jgi:hypothetical protein
MLCVYIYLAMHNFPERDPFGSYIDKDVSVHSPGRKNGCDCVREESDLCVVVVVVIVAVVAAVCCCVMWSCNILRLVTFMVELRANSV